MDSKERSIEEILNESLEKYGVSVDCSCLEAIHHAMSEYANQEKSIYNDELHAAFNIINSIVNSQSSKEMMQIRDDIREAAS